MCITYLQEDNKGFVKSENPASTLFQWKFADSNNLRPNQPNVDCKNTQNKDEKNLSVMDAYFSMSAVSDDLRREYITKCEDAVRTSTKRALSFKSEIEPPAKKKGGSSKYRGVYWNTSSNCWRARTLVNGKREHLGNFKNEVDAALAFDKRAMELGRFDSLNFTDALAC